MVIVGNINDSAPGKVWIERKPFTI
jgi:hypothetical protein